MLSNTFIPLKITHKRIQSFIFLQLNPGYIQLLLAIKNIWGFFFFGYLFILKYGVQLKRGLCG